MSNKSNETINPCCRGGGRTRSPAIHADKGHGGRHPSFTADHPKTLEQVVVAAKP